MRTVLIDENQPNLEQLHEIGPKLYDLQSQYADAYHRIETTVQTDTNIFKVPFWWVLEQYPPDNPIHPTPGIQRIKVDLIAEFAG